MAMTRKLWSINALAAEFDLDRRTVGLRIKGIPPAGQRRGHDAWALRDVAPRLLGDRHIERVPSGNRSNDMMLEIFVDRLQNFEEISEQRDSLDCDPDAISLDDAAEFLRVDVDDLLHWLRAGAPYTRRGNFETGEGFTVCLAHLFDWHLLVQAPLVLAEKWGQRAFDGRPYRAWLNMNFEPAET